jgi:2-polyprenyl-3-methyl-5-hydroxy-6-metoxy-1,4-benzoquinol methylase
VTLDPDAVKQYQFRLFSQLQGALTAALVHLGDRLGLYTALGTAAGPLSSTELAQRTGLDERWVREWAFNQGAAQLVSVEGDGARISLTPEAAAVVATPEHEAFGLGDFDHLPFFLSTTEQLELCFRSGTGRDYDSQGTDGAKGQERTFEPWFGHHLVPDVLAALDGVPDALERGIEVADIGCGAGGAVLLMGRAFANSRFTGYDISRYALDRAEQRLAESGLTNASFADPRERALPDDHRLGLVTMFDCLHDMTHPQAMADAVRASLADDGTWLLVDIKAFDSFAENVERNPMAALMYGFSVLSCMSSGLSEPGGAGLGTLGMPESKALEIAEQAGFTRFRRLGVKHSTNAFYEIRP